MLVYRAPPRLILPPPAYANGCTGIIADGELYKFGMNLTFSTRDLRSSSAAPRVRRRSTGYSNRFGRAEMGGKEGKRHLASGPRSLTHPPRSQGCEAHFFRQNSDDTRRRARLRHTARSPRARAEAGKERHDPLRIQDDRYLRAARR